MLDRTRRKEKRNFIWKNKLLFKTEALTPIIDQSYFFAETKSVNIHEPAPLLPVSAHGSNSQIEDK